jgi:hypothetical protein
MDGARALERPCGTILDRERHLLSAGRCSTSSVSRKFSPTQTGRWRFTSVLRSSCLPRTAGVCDDFNVCEPLARVAALSGTGWRQRCKAWLRGRRSRSACGSPGSDCSRSSKRRSISWSPRHSPVSPGRPRRPGRRSPSRARTTRSWRRSSTTASRALPFRTGRESAISPNGSRRSPAGWTWTADQAVARAFAQSYRRNRRLARTGTTRSERHAAASIDNTRRGGSR